MTEGPVDFLWICGFVEGPGKSFCDQILGCWVHVILWKDCWWPQTKEWKGHFESPRRFVFLSTNNYIYNIYKSLFIICVYLWFHFFQPSKKIKQAKQTIRYSEHLSVSRSVARNDFNRCWRQSMTLWRLAFLFEALNVTMNITEVSFPHKKSFGCLEP